MACCSAKIDVTFDLLDSHAHAQACPRPRSLYALLTIHGLPLQVANVTGGLLRAHAQACPCQLPERVAKNTWPAVLCRSRSPLTLMPTALCTCLPRTRQQVRGALGYRLLCVKHRGTGLLWGFKAHSKGRLHGSCVPRDKAAGAGSTGVQGACGDQG